MQIHALLTDAYGGHGGVAVYNRDLLEAFCAHPAVDRVVALPRVISRPLEPLPPKLVYRQAAAGGARTFALAVARELPAMAHSQFIYCAHINLAPVAWALGRMFRIPVLCGLYGIEAWSPTGRSLTDRLAPRLDRYYAISEITRQRFLAWAPAAEGRVDLLPNAIHAEQYGEGPRCPDLARRLGLEDRTVIMTFGRLVSRERAKGFDEVLQVLPDLTRDVPDIAYVIAGDGDYRPELERRVAQLGLGDRVVFTGMVAEAEKPALYRLADVYVMPSRGEGFGFVFLEAMACGVPVVASSLDGSRDAVRNGELGRMVDPDQAGELRRAILEALSDTRGVPDGLSYFSFSNFTQRAHAIVDGIADEGSRAA